MNLASTDWRELSDEDLRLLHTIGDLLSIAIERARLYDRSVELGAAEERNRLARELHDTLAQGLAAVALQLETADALLDAGADREAVRSRVRNALMQTRANLEEARRSVLDLRAAPLEGKTLVEALQALADNTDAEATVRVHFETTGGHPLPARLEVGLYRIAQEALHNILRHAEAQQAHLRLETTPDQVTLSVEDDGHGFDPSQVPGDRFGLIGISERARLLGGILRLQSGPGAGTKLEVMVPRRLQP
jgi:two-component system NarL family sensor kinase